MSRARALLLIVVASSSCVGQDPDTTDALRPRPALPATSLVEVAPGVSLEVLEWSQNGEPLILLAGATHSAHVYRDLAPHLTDQFRVLGITRRRVGASSVPTEPFGIADLVSDIIAVQDALAIPSAHFIAHSFGGAELSYLALSHPRRVRRLVYLDASWDFARVYYADDWWDPWPSMPILAADSASPQALSAHFARTWGPLFPLEEVEAIHRFDSNGKLVALDPNVGSMFRNMIGPTLDTLNFSRIAQPTLTVRAIPKAVDDLFRGYAGFGPSDKRLAEATFERWVRVIVAEGDRFVDQVPDIRDLRLEGAHHDLLNLEPERFLPAVRRFLIN